MPAMTGVGLHRHLIKVGYAIPTILVTGYPNDVDRTRALNDGSFVTFVSQLMRRI
jgi:FixJ family two-component response regulator